MHRPNPDDQLRRIRIALHAQDLHLCRMGDRDEWIALGLTGSPSLRYSKGRWVCSHLGLRTLVNQALGETHGKRKRRLPSKARQPKRPYAASATGQR